MVSRSKKKLYKTLARVAPGINLRLRLLRACGYQIEEGAIFAENVFIIDELEDEGNLYVGKDSGISCGTILITTSDPTTSKVLKEKVGRKKGPIVIENDVWVGAGAIIFPGVTVGKYSVVAAGAVVTKDVPPKTIVAGVPAKVVKKLEINDEDQT